MKMTIESLLTPAEMWNAKIYSAGWKKPGLGTADVIEKATGAKLGEIGIASAEDVAAAATAAGGAQKEWAKQTGPKRGDVLREVSRLLLANSKEIADQLMRETGSIRAKAQWEVHITAREFLEAAELGSQPRGVLTATLEDGQQSLARRIPLGVVGIITPWNSPLILAARAVAPALAMGNAVILKPDVQTPIIGGVIFARLLEKSRPAERTVPCFAGRCRDGRRAREGACDQYDQLYRFDARRAPGRFDSERVTQTRLARTRR